jgi:hypothetical protein
LTIDSETAGTQGGGGIAVDGGTTSLAGTTQVQNNEASTGGGIMVTGGSLTIAETCRVTLNTATASATAGGGIANNVDPSTVTLEGADPSPIVVNNCQDNCGGLAVDKCALTPTFYAP